MNVCCQLPQRAHPKGPNVEAQGCEPLCGEASSWSAVLGVKSIDEFVGGDTSLFEQADERAYFHFTVVWHNAPRGAATHDDMTAPLAGDHKTEVFQCPDDFGAGNDREFRHAPEPGRWSAEGGR